MIEREQILLSAVEAAHDMILITDRSGRIRYVNPSFTDCTGYTQDEALGQTPSLLKSGRQDKRFYIHLWSTIAAGKVWHGRLINRRKDGSEYLEEQTITPILDSNSEISAYVAIKRDLSVLESMEEQLLLSAQELGIMRHQLEFLFAHIDDFIYVHDFNGVFSYVSPSVKRITGYEAEHWKTHYSNFLVDSSTNRMAVKSTQLAIATLESQDPFLVELRHKNGQIVTLEVSECIYQHDESPQGIIGIARDVTKRLEMQQRLEQTDRLEALGELAAGIAHEINSPLQYIGDNLRYLDKSFARFTELLEVLHGEFVHNLPTAERERIDGAWKAAKARLKIDKLCAEVPNAIADGLDGVDRVSEIIQSMRFASYPSSGSSALTDVVEAINNAATLTRNEWKYYAELVIDCETNLPPIGCSPGVFSQVLINLIKNAVDAIRSVQQVDSDKGRISVSAGKQCGGVVVLISDSGCGVPRDISKKIFDPFFTTKEVGKGTGQGLYIVHSIVVGKLGGRVDVRSAEGSGTTIELHIPAAMLPNGEPAAV